MKGKHYLIIIVVIVCAVIGYRGFQTFSHYNEIKNIYQKAEDFIINEDFDSALELLNNIESEGYQDTKDYVYLCKSHNAYDNGNIDIAYRMTNYGSLSCQNEFIQAKMDTYIEEVAAEYEVWYEQDQKDKKAAYEEELRNSVPYEGMSEKNIGNTSLGSPSSNIRHNNECINGKQYRANLYDFMEGGDVIFTARCVQGKVIQVWDNRDKPSLSYGSNSSSNSHKDSSQTDKSDPYDVYDYSDPEDFYYDNYDDFYDYEDAEDYWNEAQ